MLNTRTCGVLLHPSSLPGWEGIGTLGDEARRFVDLLADMGMSFWQMLPLTPPAIANSPYSAFSAFAGNPLLIDCQDLAREGDLPAPVHRSRPVQPRVNFKAVSTCKQGQLRRAAETFLASGRPARMEEFWHFCDSTPWLHEYALFMAIKRHFRGKSWHRWPVELALHQPQACDAASRELGAEIGIQKYLQWQFFRQWRALREYAAVRGIACIGDLPIFVAYDSADVWSRRELFLLDENGRPTSVAGVPPDYFSATGQLWGNPLYDWPALRARGYDWWIQRFRHMLHMFQTVRIDHFRGFEAAWHVPAEESTAVHGAWVAGPGNDLFDAVAHTLGSLSIIAEDLGVITPEVEQLRDRCGFPGMKILQFAFDSGPRNPYLPHNHVKNCVVYTGTHDNSTTRGWWEQQAPELRRNVRDYLGCSEVKGPEAVLRAALMSVANTVIIPFQDLLGLGDEARMNIPGTARDNWEWRFCWSMVPPALGHDVRTLVGRYGRLNG